MLKFSEDEKKVWRRFWRTGVGQKGLAMIKELEDDVLRQGMVAAATDKPTELTNNYLVRAAAIDTVYYLLKPDEAKREDDDDN